MANDVEWIKITTDMFDNKKIKKLRRLPDGNNIVLIWVMLLTLAGKSNAAGMILISENVPYTVEDLADELKFEINTVKFALEALERMGMVYKEDESIVISNWYEYQNQDGLEKIREQTKKRVASFRERQKLGCNVTVTLPVTQSSYSISNSISNSNNTEEDINTKKFKPPSVEEVRAYCSERNNGIDADSFVNFYSSKGWMIGKNKMKDWKAAVRTWEKNRKGNAYGNYIGKGNGSINSESEISDSQERGYLQIEAGVSLSDLQRKWMGNLQS